MPAPTTSLLSQFSSEIAGLVAGAAPATVAITAKGRAMSGFFWCPNVVVTASEALDAEFGAEVETVSQAGTARMKLAGRDPTTAIAILTTEPSTTGVVTPLRMAPSVAGQVAVVSGRSPRGLSCAVGFVSLAGDAWESMRGGKIDQRIQLGQRIEAHQEGGPVLDAAGAAIGMAVRGPRRRTLVIPAITIERIAAQLLQDGRIKQGYFGVAGQPIRLETAATQATQATQQGVAAQTGLMVLRLDRNGPAHAAGILQGDIITTIAGKPIGSPRELRRSLGPDTVGRTVACTIIRAGQPLTRDVAVTERQTR